ncbi:MAG TPA: hypothetical protein VD999_06180 [Vitreimonas sp.]|nr:hypothetical protein [Vitreimonas sp.]
MALRVEAYTRLSRDSAIRHGLNVYDEYLAPRGSGATQQSYLHDQPPRITKSAQELNTITVDLKYIRQPETLKLLLLLQAYSPHQNLIRSLNSIKNAQNPHNEKAKNDELNKWLIKNYPPHELTEICQTCCDLLQVLLKREYQAWMNKKNIHKVGDFVRTIQLDRAPTPLKNSNKYLQ